MLDIGWPELLVIGIVTLLVVGPKELPRVLRTITNLARKARTMAREFQSSIDDIAREADLEDFRNELSQAASHDFEREVQNSIDPTGTVSEMFQGDPLAEPESADSKPDEIETEKQANVAAPVEAEAKPRREAESAPTPDRAKA